MKETFLSRQSKICFYGKLRCRLREMKQYERFGNNKVKYFSHENALKGILIAVHWYSISFYTDTFNWGVPIHVYDGSTIQSQSAIYIVAHQKMFELGREGGYLQSKLLRTSYRISDGFGKGDGCV